MHDTVRWITLHAVPYIRKSLCLQNTQGSTLSGMPDLVTTAKHGGGSVMLWVAIWWYSILLVPLLLFMAELLQGSTWPGWVIMCIPWSRYHFWTMMQFSDMIMPPFTKLELFSHSLKSMKVNFTIFPGQHNHQIWISMNHLVSFGV
jgi:hypothetical protein